MSPWLFNIYIDDVVREVNPRMLGRGKKKWAYKMQFGLEFRNLGLNYEHQVKGFRLTFITLPTFK